MVSNLVFGGPYARRRCPTLVRPALDVEQGPHPCDGLMCGGGRTWYGLLKLVSGVVPAATLFDGAIRVHPVHVVRRVSDHTASVAVGLADPQEIQHTLTLLVFGVRVDRQRFVAVRGDLTAMTALLARRQRLDAGAVEVERITIEQGSYDSVIDRDEQRCRVMFDMVDFAIARPFVDSSSTRRLSGRCSPHVPWTM